MKKYLGAILILSSVAMLFIALRYQMSELKTVRQQVESQRLKVVAYDSLKRTCDSIESELFIEHINVGRYESALYRLESEDSITAAIFQIYLNQSE
jgi:hypothetical protein